MSDPYLGEIRMFGGNFAPAGWHFCDGSLLPISQYDALFTLIGTTYGGDGETSFAVPDMRGRLPLGAGTAASGTPYALGQRGGTETATLTTAQIPSHTHTALGAVGAATSGSPTAGVWAASTGPAFVPVATPPTVPMAPGALAPVGGGQPHENRPPFTVVTFIIAVYGRYPSQD